MELSEVFCKENSFVRSVNETDSIGPHLRLKPNLVSILPCKER